MMRLLIKSIIFCRVFHSIQVHAVVASFRSSLLLFKLLTLATDFL